MKRRQFIGGLAGLAAWRGSAMAQPAIRRYRIGVLDTSARALNGNFSAFEQGLRVLGYVEGVNLAFEYRSAEGNNGSFPELAADLARAGVDLIVTRGTPAALAARAATSTIPVVMAAVGDPEAIVRGARPASNLTGFGANIAGAERQRVGILKELLPQVARVAALMNLSNPSRQAEWHGVEAAARALAIEPQVLDIRSAADIARALDAAVGAQADALVVGSDTIMQANQDLLIEAVAAHRLPAIYTFRDFVEAGGLVSYGVSLPDLYRRAAAYAAMILQGVRPAALPLAPPEKAELAINLRTAATLGIAISEDMRGRAERLIE
jgi:putative ABC transport system substrate-binding protein